MKLTVKNTVLLLILAGTAMVLTKCLLGVTA